MGLGFETGGDGVGNLLCPRPILRLCLRSKWIRVKWHRSRCCPYYSIRVLVIGYQGRQTIPARLGIGKYEIAKLVMLT